MAAADLFERAAAVFEEALDQPPATRVQFVARACGDDGELRAEVESLLEHHARAGSDFLASPVAVQRLQQPAAPAWAAAFVGRKIGRYTVRRLLGHGGMGCVFGAQQERPSRTVALKVLQPGFSTPSALARFRLEPEVLGRLQHPNIAQVFEAGVHDDESGLVPYFAMEYIPDAQPLPDYADAHELGTAQRLELFATVCDAIHHGHQRSIIHRDIKPANILVGASGQPKVIDFGVARASDADIVLTTQCTHVGDLVGTVHYMSPEQCDGNPAAIDTRSDVYSLGVVLFELLTGAAPYDTSDTTLYGAIRMIKEQPPRRPSEAIMRHERAAEHRRRLARELRGDLDAILLKALEKDPARRYGSAADLARDIRRHLAGDPVEARRAGLWTRVLRWAGRRPRLAATVAAAAFLGLVATATIAGLWVYVWYYFREPDRIEYGPENRSARLLNRRGTPIGTWSAGPTGSLVAEFVRLYPDEDDLRHVAVLYRASCASEHRRQVQLFDLNRTLREPLWRWQLRDEDVPSIIVNSGFCASDFSPVHVWSQNIFPEESGTPVSELLVWWSHHLSWRALCIVDRAGQPLYAIWHDGGQHDWHWLPELRLLLVAGENQELAPHMRGCPSANPGNEMLVVFALRPRAGMVTPRTVHELKPSDDGELAWYKWLSVCPLPKTSRGILVTGPEISVADPTAVAQVSVQVQTDPPCSVSWLINSRGERVGQHIAPHYRTMRANPRNAALDLPPVEAYELQDTPPGQ